ncbi:MAG TPA: hypothetical protein VM537_19795 [Anaerolineae bacterium]|nr:hypothetical protein [Anaerolineae bacterium]
MIKFFSVQARQREVPLRLSRRGLHHDGIVRTGWDAYVAAIALGCVNVWRLVPLEAQHSPSPAGRDHRAAGAGLTTLIIDDGRGPAG